MTRKKAGQLAYQLSLEKISEYRVTRFRVWSLDSDSLRSIQSEIDRQPGNWDTPDRENKALAHYRHLRDCGVTHIARITWQPCVEISFQHYRPAEAPDARRYCEAYIDPQHRHYRELQADMALAARLNKLIVKIVTPHMAWEAPDPLLEALQRARAVRLHSSPVDTWIRDTVVYAPGYVDSPTLDALYYQDTPVHASLTAS